MALLLKASRVITPIVLCLRFTYKMLKLNKIEIKDKDYDEVINDQNISEKIESHKDDKKMAATYQMYEAFINPDPIARTTLSILENTPYGEKNNVDVYVKADRSFKKTIGNFRSTGMLIRTYRKMIFQHYAAVVVVRGEKLG